MFFYFDPLSVVVALKSCTSRTLKWNKLQSLSVFLIGYGEITSRSIFVYL